MSATSAPPVIDGVEWVRPRPGRTGGVIVIAMFAWLFWALIYYSAVQDYLPDLPREGALSP